MALLPGRSPVGEPPRRRPARLRAPASRATVIPGLHACSPSTTTRSPGLRPLVDDPELPLAGPSLTVLERRLVVGARRRPPGRPPAARSPRAGAQERALDRAVDGADLRVLAGPQEVAGVREEPLQVDRAGRHVHLAVRRGTACPRWG